MNVKIAILIVLLITGSIFTGECADIGAGWPREARRKDNDQIITDKEWNEAVEYLVKKYDRKKGAGYEKNRQPA